MSERRSSSSPNRMDSDGYPSWLPKRPPPPPPASTFHSSVGAPEPGPSEPSPFLGGRKPTPRSVRIVSLQESYAEQSRREPTDQTRVANNSRAWSRATGAAMSPAVFSSTEPYESRHSRPRFNSRGLHLELLRNPSLKSRLYFYIYPILVFAHIPVQTFFDFNAVFMMLQVSKFPNPQAPGVPGSGRNWALGAAAYIACWLVWIMIVFTVYELVFSFARRWRVKRPLMMPIYLSSPSFNLVCMTSYSNFCFLQHLRFSAFFGESGSIRDGLAETFWYYSQNLPTVALLMPRAGLSLALLLAFTIPQVGVVALADAGVSHRDATFFRQDGTLTNYARGVLISNATWTAWRVLVLLISWIGLWVLSGQGCAGLCGPRYRWEEEEAEKRKSFYSDAEFDEDVPPWSWRECTQLRIQEAYDFCLTIRPSLKWGHGKKEVSDATDVLRSDSPNKGEPFVEHVLAAVGFPSMPPPARRGMLSEDLFESPKDSFSLPAPGLSDIIPKVAKRSSKDKVAGPSAPLMSLPYPFTAHGAQMSSADKVPFPPSPVSKKSKKSRSGTTSRATSRTTSATTSGSMEEEEEEEEGEDESNDDDDDDDDDGNEDQEEDEEGDNEFSEEPSSGRASGSMSSLGHPVASRYPFQFRLPPRGNSMSSSGAISHISPTTHSRSIHSRISQGTQSTGNPESTDSQSPRSHATSSSDVANVSASGFPMPPRHSQQIQGRGRQRSGSVPAPIPASPSPVVFPTTGRPRAQTGMEAEMGSLSQRLSGASLDLGHESADDHASSESSQEAAEREDRVGLLTPSRTSSPRTSLLHRGSAISLHRLHSSRSRSNTRSNSQSGSSSSRSRTNSIAHSVRSRAQSMMQGIGAASHSSLELVQTAIRSRANSSMARLEEDSPYSSDARTHSRSGSASTNENYTFGHPLRIQWPAQEEQRLEEEPSESSPHSPNLPPSPASPPPQPQLRQTHSSFSVGVPSSLHPSEAASQEPSEDTTQRLPTPVNESSPETEYHSLAPTETEAIDIPVPIRVRDVDRDDPISSVTSSPPDISTAAQSFVTMPATVIGTTESSGETVSSWGDITHMVDRADPAWRPA